MKKSKLILCALVVAGCARPAESADAPELPAVQSEEDEVVAVVLSLFEAMRTNDGELAASVFHPTARMGRAQADGISFNGPEGFIEAVGRDKDVVWDEPIWDWEVHVDDRLAHMWTKYAFYAGDEFSHCGVDAIDLYKTDDGWKITQLIDTMRREDCWFPPGR